MTAQPVGLLHMAYLAMSSQVDNRNNLIFIES